MITEKAHAKINLTLDIVGESRGFHLLDMLVASISLADEVIISERSDENVVCYMDGIYQNNLNSAVKAALLMQEEFRVGGFDIEIKKDIPLAGGLGGSTADGVAVIRGIAKLLDIPSKKISAEFLLRLGSDAPCMYCTGVKRVGGIGEKVTEIGVIWPYNIGFIAGSGVNTSAAYAAFDRLKIPYGNSTQRLIENLDKADFKLADYLSNSLYMPAVSLNPDIESSLNRIKQTQPDGFNMSGSGSTVYGLYNCNVPEGLSAAAFTK